jgi:hypothetical protein
MCVVSAPLRDTTRLVIGKLKQVIYFCDHRRQASRSGYCE